MPGPVSPISTTAQSSVPARCGRSACPVPPIAPTALSIRLVHTWLSSAAYAGIGGRLRSYSLTTVMPVPILPAEHHQRGVEQLVHVDHLVRRPVELRVLLGRADQRGDPGDRVVDLAHQQLGLERVRQPAHRRLEVAPRRPRSATCSSHVDVEPGRDQRRREVPAAGDVVRPPASRRARPRRRWSPSGSASAPWRPARPPPPAARPARAACSASSRPSASMRQLVPHAGDPLAQRRGGPDGGRGRVVQLVGEPGRQRAERQQPLPLADDASACCACRRTGPRAGASPSGTSRA